MTNLYLANINHEVRTLISAIFACANLLEEYVDDRRDAVDLVRVIRRNGEHLLTLVDNALDLSKLESGKMTTRSTRCDIGQMVGEVLALMTAQARAKGLRLEARCDGPVPRWVVTDPLRLRQILLNLFSNAIKFTDEGEVNLTVRRIDASDAPSRLCFEVADTGVGIDTDQCERIFEPFVQIEPCDNRGGTGLGLAISRMLAQRLNGDLTVSSTPGQGSVFSLEIAPSMCSGADCIDTIPRLLVNDRPSQRTLPASADSFPARLEGVNVMLHVERSDLRLLLSVALKCAGANLILAAPEEPLTRVVDRICHGNPPAHVLLTALDRNAFGRASTGASLQAAASACCVVAIRPQYISSEAVGRLEQADVACFTEPIDTLQIVRVISRAAAARANRSAG